MSIRLTIGAALLLPKKIGVLADTLFQILLHIVHFGPLTDRRLRCTTQFILKTARVDAGVTHWGCERDNQHARLDPTSNALAASSGVGERSVAVIFK